MNELMTFDFNGHSLSAQIDENSQGLFLAKEACECMGLKNVSRALERLDDDEKLTLPIVMSGQIRNMWHVTEPGMYQLAFLSRTKQAKDFKRWLAHEVIPAIRRKKYCLPEGMVVVEASQYKHLETMVFLYEETDRLRKMIYKHGRPLSAEERETVLEMVKNNYSVADITRILNRSSTYAVRSYLKKVQAYDKQ